MRCRAAELRAVTAAGQAESIFLEMAYYTEPLSQSGPEHFGEVLGCYVVIPQRQSEQ